MAFLHYLRFDGIEIANAARVDTYAHALNLGFHKCQGICETLPAVLDKRGWKKDVEYTTPKGDHAPWYDNTEPWGEGFAGMHVLDASNFNSSMWEAQSNEALTDGGFVSRGRFHSREMTFRVLLLGTDLHAVQHGLNWLSTVLHRGDPCKDDPNQAEHHMYREYLYYWTRYKDEASISEDDDMYQGPLVTSDPHTYAGVRSSLDKRYPITQPAIDEFLECEGFRMEFFLRCPDLDDYQRLYRYFLDVHCTAGPTVLSAHEMDEVCGGGAWAEVEFTLVAANPFAYRTSIDLAKDSSTFTYADLLPEGTTKPWWPMYKNAVPISDDNVYEAPLMYRDIPHTYTGLNEVLFRKTAGLTTAPLPLSLPTVLAGPVWTDPACPPPAAYPSAPQTNLMCTPPYEGPWKRIVYRAGTYKLPKFTESTLLMEFAALGQTFSDVRVRLVPEGGDLDTEFDIQFYINHLPDGATMRIDGRRRSIVMYSGEFGSSQFMMGPASHLVTTDSSAAAYRFPTLICGGRMNIVIDVRDTDDVDKLGVGVRAIGREG